MLASPLFRDVFVLSCFLNVSFPVNFTVPLFVILSVFTVLPAKSIFPWFVIVVAVTSFPAKLIEAPVSIIRLEFRKFISSSRIGYLTHPLGIIILCALSEGTE